MAATAAEFIPEEEPPSSFQAKDILNVSVRRASSVALPQEFVKDKFSACDGPLHYDGHAAEGLESVTEHHVPLSEALGEPRR